MSQAPLRIIQISDLHLFSDQGASLLGVKTQDSFQAVLNLIKQEEKYIDLILLTGDLSQDGSAASYQRLAKMMSEFHVPVYCIPGNHDDSKTMVHVYPLENISNHKHIILRNWHIILLDSHKPGAVEGYLNSSQLDYLQHCLQVYPEHHAMVVCHHHPLPVGAAWLDRIGLINAEEFWTILSSYPKVNSILFGHVHQEFVGEKQGIKCFALPSTCIQFNSNQAEFGLVKLPPGYRWLTLTEDGQVETGIKRVASYVGEFDENAHGY